MASKWFQSTTVTEKLLDMLNKVTQLSLQIQGCCSLFYEQENIHSSLGFKFWISQYQLASFYSIANREKLLQILARSNLVKADWLSVHDVRFLMSWAGLMDHRIVARDWHSSTEFYVQIVKVCNIILMRPSPEKTRT